MRDVQSGGRLIAGFMRGISHEYVAYNVSPDDSYPRMREACKLIVKCRTEPEPCGLVPCAAAVTVLIVCLHLEKFWLGVGLVGAFSAGLASMLVAVGATAAVGVSAARIKYAKLDVVLAKAPYVSSLLIALIGVAMLASGAAHLASPH